MPPQSEPETHDALSPQDIAEIHNVAALYGHVLDQENWDALDRVFAPHCVYDGSWTGSTRHEGLAAVRKYLGRPHHAVHHTTNIYLEAHASGDRVAGIAKWLVVHEDLRVASGDYRDIWIRTPHGWRLEERTSYRIIPAPAPPGAPSSR